MANFPIVGAFARKWWVLLLRGLIAILFAILAFAQPGLTLLTLILLYGFYALTDGFTAILVGGGSRAWGMMLCGILGVLAGIYTFFYPVVTTLILLYVMAGWLLVRGILEIATAIQMRKEITNEWMLIINGILSILVSIFLVARPGASLLAIVSVIGVYALVSGVLFIFLAFRLKSLLGRLEREVGV